MRITRAWLDETYHCEDGRAFGIATLPPEGLELEECWPLIFRADWAVGLAIKSGAITHEAARGIVFEAARVHAMTARQEGRINMIYLLCRLWSQPNSAAQVRDEARSLADACLFSVPSDLRACQELLMVGLLAASDFDVNRGSAGELLQAAAFMLGVVAGQEATAGVIIAKVKTRIAMQERATA